jgi:aminoglycoside phosphotransferase (APT) family kinase protein
MSYDDVAWAKSYDTLNDWKKRLYTEQSFKEIGELIAKHRGGIPAELCAPIRGSFNVCLRVKFEDGGSAMIRFPCPGFVMFPEEKIRNEVAIMRFIEQNTSIPIPHVIYHGMTDESPCGLGPFIIMDYIEHTHDLVDALNTPGLTLDDRPVLDPQISTERLEFVYSQMSDILLELHKHSFARIGSLTRTDDDSWAVTSRPLTLNMNELVQLGNFPRSQLPSTFFHTSSTYMQALADMHLMHLSTQRNDAVDSATDCRRKYIARHLFRRLASQSRLSSGSSSEASKLFCCDLRPSNVLVNKDFKIVAVIDWEFTYAAPADFAYSPPWWLLLEAPEYWSAGLSDWAVTYEPRLRTFLRVLETREEAAMQSGTLDHQQRLSQRMRESWENGQFWVNYAARKSWAFDALFWSWIDAKYFGEGDWFEDRIQLLEEKELKGIEEFVRRKLEERKKRILYYEDTEEPEDVEPQMTCGQGILAAKDHSPPI